MTTFDFSFGNSNNNNNGNNKMTMLFPSKLMGAISDPRNADAITWLPHGKAFVILNRKNFENHVLPSYFGTRGIKYEHFLAKLLKHWNFIRLKSSTGRREIYFHKYFQRDRPTLCNRMLCYSSRRQSQFQVARKNTKGRIPATTEGGSIMIQATKKPVQTTFVEPPFPSNSALLKSSNAINNTRTSCNGTKDTVSITKIFSSYKLMMVLLRRTI